MEAQGSPTFTITHYQQEMHLTDSFPGGLTRPQLFSNQVLLFPPRGEEAECETALLPLRVPT